MILTRLLYLKPLSAIAINISIHACYPQRFSFPPIGTCLLTLSGTEISNSPIRVNGTVILVQFERIGIIRYCLREFTLFQIAISPVQVVSIYQLVLFPVLLGILDCQRVLLYGCRVILLILVNISQIITKLVILLEYPFPFH